MICWGLSSARRKNSWAHVSRLKNTTIVFRIFHLVAGADDTDCCHLRNWLTLRESGTAEIKFRKFSSTRPSVSRPFTVLATGAPYLGVPFSGPWDVCSLIRRVASSNNYKFTAPSWLATKYRNGGCPGVPVHEGIPFVFITIHGVMTQFVNVSFLCVPVHEDTTQKWLRPVIEWLK